MRMHGEIFSKNTIDTSFPFFFFIEDDEPHITEMDALLNACDKNPYELYLHRFRIMDATVEFVRKFLNEKGLFDDTVFLLYGGHGNELFSHHIYEGDTHAIEPYPDMCNAPLIVHVGISENETGLLICTTDGLMSVAFKIVGIEK